MLERIVDLSLRFKLLVIVATLLVIVLGVMSWKRIPLDAFPDITPVQVTIYTEVPGVAAEDVEQLVTFPVETAVAALPGVQQVRSFSLFGLSYVTVYFDDDVNIYFARQVVNERLLEAKERIPEGFGTPVLGPNSSGLGQVYWYALHSDDPNVSLTQLRTIQDWTVRMIMRTAPGVDDVLSWGGHEKQYQVLIDPSRLVKYGLELPEVLSLLAASNRQVGAQSITFGQEQYAVRGVGRVRDVNDIATTVLSQRNGVPVQVRDVAEVREGAGLRFGAITIDGKEAVLGIALQRIGENAEGVVKGVREKVERLKGVLPQSVSVETIYDRTAIIGKAIAMADRAMIEGVVLVVAVLFLFMGDFRAALVVVVAIPMARLIAFILMDQVGLTANLLSLGGLVIGLGMTIDGPLVLAENAARRLGEAAGSKEKGASNRSAIVLAAAKEVMNPITFGLLIIAVVFIPLLSLEGLEGKLFKPLAWNMIFAIAGSLMLTITIIPVLSALLIPLRHDREPWVLQQKPRTASLSPPAVL